MTEPGQSRPASREDGGQSPRGAAQLDDCHSDPENVTEERRRRGRMAVECLQAADQEPQEASGRRKPVLVRSKTFDNSLLTQVQTDLDSKIERKKSHYSQLSKSNCQYHKIFKEISKEEQLRQSYTCALQKDMLYQGRMFVSDHWICFHSKVFGRDTKIAIPVTSITNIKKTKTAILVPNALVVATANDRYVFVSLMARDNTYKFLMSVCLHLEEKSPCSSPIPSSAEHSFRGQRSPLVSRFPLSDFSELDGAATQIRPEIEDSSSSDSQTPDDDKLAGFPATPLLDVLAHSDKAAPPPEQQLRARQQQLNQQSPEKSLTGSEVMINSRVLRPISLSTLLIVYMFLVCVLVLSSCFLAFKIVSLEQKLQTLGSVSDFTHNVNGLLSGGADLNTEIFSEVLTINLLKLERVQKNLQRLLEEAD